MVRERTDNQRGLRLPGARLRESLFSAASSGSYAMRRAA
jgi:hypothetical protein